MGWKTIRLAFEIGRALDWRSKFVLVRLSEVADDKTGSKAYPSVETIARECSLSARSVKRALASLLTARYIGVEARPGFERRRSVTYRVCLEKLNEQNAAPGLTLTSSAAVQLVTNSHEAVTDGPDGVSIGRVGVTNSQKGVTNRHPICTER